MKIYQATDPGKDGGLAFFYEDGRLDLHKVPLIGDQISVFDLQQIFDVYMEDGELICAVEDVHSIHMSSAKSNFQFGRALGIIEGIVSAKKLSWFKVSPKEWQKVAWQGIPIMRKPSEKPGKDGPTDTKAMSLLAAKRLFPNESFIPTARSKKPHDGLIDAALIAYYLKVSGR